MAFLKKFRKFFTIWCLFLPVYQRTKYFIFVSQSHAYTQTDSCIAHTQWLHHLHPAVHLARTRLYRCLHKVFARDKFPERNITHTEPIKNRPAECILLISERNYSFLKNSVKHTYIEVLLRQIDVLKSVWSRKTANITERCDRGKKTHMDTHRHTDTDRHTHTYTRTRTNIHEHTHSHMDTHGHT